MWLRLPVIVLSLYLFSIIQTSFLVHFNIVGAVPNLIFILFTVIIFFSAFKKPSLNWEDFLVSIVAGFFLDVLSSTYFGLSIAFLIITAFFIKKSLALLQASPEKYPITYYAPIFVFSFVIYTALATLSSYYLHLTTLSFNWMFFVEVIYNLIFALLIFSAYKKLKLYGF